jgi:hypothetical protein
MNVAIHFTKLIMEVNIISGTMVGWKSTSYVKNKKSINELRLGT